MRLIRKALCGSARSGILCSCESSASSGWALEPIQLEVFGPSDQEHRHFVTGPVPEFLVEDLPAALEELRAAGAEILGEPHVDGSDGWLHFRAPDGNVYGLTAAASYQRANRELGAG